MTGRTGRTPLVIAVMSRPRAPRQLNLLRSDLEDVGVLRVLAGLQDSQTSFFIEFLLKCFLL